MHELSLITTIPAEKVVLRIHNSQEWSFTKKTSQPRWRKLSLEILYVGVKYGDLSNDNWNWTRKNDDWDFEERNGRWEKGKR